MQNEILFLAFLIVWLPCVIGLHIWGHRHRHHPAIIIAMHAAPTAVASSMSYLFLIRGGATVAQFSAGSEAGMDLWSAWFHLWSLLLPLIFIFVAIQLVGLVTACVKPSLRTWIPAILIGTLLSAFALYTVAVNYPDA